MSSRHNRTVADDSRDNASRHEEHFSEAAEAKRNADAIQQMNEQDRARMEARRAETKRPRR